jgi:hypothetical protein
VAGPTRGDGSLEGEGREQIGGRGGIACNIAEPSRCYWKGSDGFEFGCDGHDCKQYLPPMLKAWCANP